MKFNHDAAASTFFVSVIGGLFGLTCAATFFFLTLTGDIATVAATMITAAVAGSALATALFAGCTTPAMNADAALAEALRLASDFRAENATPAQPAPPRVPNLAPGP